MIQTNELRLGNYILTGFGMGKVLTIKKSSVVCSNGNYKHGLTFTDANIHGILLTDVLFAGIRNAIKNFTDVEEYTISNTGLIFYRYFDSSDRWFVKTNAGVRIAVIKYLHHLQNLYFAITGEELKINFELVNKV